MQKIDLKIEKEQNLRSILLNYGFSKPETNRILKNKDVKVDGKRLNEDAVVKKGTTITIFASQLPQKRFKIVFEDENVIVIDKGVEIETQGDQSLEKQLKARAVHRLDRNTTGIMIFAKTEEAESALKKAFKEKNVEKKYVCEVFGQPNFSGKVEKGYLLKDSAHSLVKIFPNFVQNSVLIETIFTTVKKSSPTSIVVAQLLTGRTHQIRAQLAFLGYPIVGDGKYGKNEINKKFKEKYQKLHCFSLKIKKIDQKFEYLQNMAFISKPDWAKKFI